jgi:colanic acid/amylovoran biosynthesis glycosyltransferase
MKIAYLINQYPAVSHSFIRREIQALERQGFEIARFALRDWDVGFTDPEDALERTRTRYVLQDGAIPLLVAFMQMACTRPMRLLRAFALACRMGAADRRRPFIHLVYLTEACRLLQWLERADIRHLHAHFGTNSAEVAMLVHALGGPTWSFTVHGPEEFDRSQAIGLAEKVRRCSFVVAISSFGRSQLFRIMEIGQWSKVHMVHCGLDAAYLDLAATPVPATRRLVCVGRLCAQKGQMLLVEAAARLGAKSRYLLLVLAGDGEMRGDVEALIERHGLQDNVHITGWLSVAQVREEILAARALVLPSFAEGLPVVLMEAMAVGRPVISTFVAGIPELVHPGEHGWLVAAGDIDGLVAAMTACLEASPEVLNYMGAAGRKRVRAEHDIDVEAAKLAGLFKELA